ncbi:hypothetical protein RJ639_018051 [Escallonia herrerae]|uniref:MRG domain-containing protein n=1 Tax=Escallonia herrerae TaxID=1293975 RepID=A0AA88V975_9ASTE|nr:hypothetical protein RJ639_018051 [Escallonia herrerae]
MGSSNAVFTDDSATISDDGTETDMDMAVESRDDDVESPPPSDSSPFQEGEKVLAYHSQHLYPAKSSHNLIAVLVCSLIGIDLVQMVEYQMKEWKYYVHYLVISFFFNSWDEWVGIDRLLKCTEENAKKQEVLDKNHGAEKNVKPARTSQNKPKNSTVTRGKKRKNDPVPKNMLCLNDMYWLTGYQKGTSELEQLMPIQIPSTLKKQLVDDCEYITHMGKLVKLPRTPNVDEILKMYVEYRLKMDGWIADSVQEILNGLHCYFDKALPAMLLYKSERLQYQEAIADDVSPSTVYGAEHLLRLFVKLPEMLGQANIEKETLIELQQKLVDFLKYGIHHFSDSRYCILTKATPREMLNQYAISMILPCRFLQKNQIAFFLSTYQTPEGSVANTEKQDG